jgi:hypothetical protein
VELGCRRRMAFIRLNVTWWLGDREVMDKGWQIQCHDGRYQCGYYFLMPRSSRVCVCEKPYGEVDIR